MMVLLGTLAGCSGSKGADASTSPEDRATPVSTPTLLGEAPDATPNARQLSAEQVHDRANMLLDSYLPKYGEGAKSPCSAASSRLFTADCASAVAAMQTLTADLNNSIAHQRGFETLRIVLTKSDEAAKTYSRLGCQANPKGISLRQQCSASGATIAQSPADVREGARLALAGK